MTVVRQSSLNTTFHYLYIFYLFFSIVHCTVSLLPLKNSKRKSLHSVPCAFSTIKKDYHTGAVRDFTFKKLCQCQPVVFSYSFMTIMFRKICDYNWKFRHPQQWLKTNFCRPVLNFWVLQISFKLMMEIHRTTEWLRVEGTSAGHLAQAPYSSRAT